MATIQSILSFQDKMSAVIDKVAKSLENATNKSNATKKAIDTLENEQTQFQQSLNSTNNAINNVNNSVNNASSGLNSMQGKIITLASAFQLFNQVKSIIGGVNAKINEFVSYAETEMRVQDQLSIITKQRMGLMDDEIRSLYDLASAQQQVGVVGDEVTVAGMAGIAAFVRQKSSIEALTPAMDNLAVKMYGYNATAESMDMISKSLGKAMLGDVGALSRMGIKIDDNQKKWLMSLNEQERAVELANLITAVTGNMNEEMAKTPFGQMTQATNRLSDSYERLGAALLPLQASVIEGWSKIVDFVVSKLDTIVPLAVTALSTISFAFVALKVQALLTSQESIKAAIASIKVWWGAAAPFIAIIGIIGGVSLALKAMGVDFRTQAENILISINWIITAVKNLIAHIENIGIAIHNAFSKNKWDYKQIEANDLYTNQEKAQRQMNAIKGGALTNRALLGTTGKGGAFDSSLITSTAGGKALKTQNQGEIEINEEDLQLLHDMATRDYMINYQQQNLTPQVNMPNVVIHETADVDSVVESLVSAVTDLAQSKLVRA